MNDQMFEHYRMLWFKILKIFRVVKIIRLMIYFYIQIKQNGCSL